MRVGRRRWASITVAAGSAALLVAGLSGAGTAAEPDHTREQLSVAASCPQPPLPTPAGDADYYLKIDGIEGESTSDRHAGEIEVESFGLGVNQENLLHCATASPRAAFTPLVIAKRIDRSSPVLMEGTATGKHFPEAVLTAERKGRNGKAGGNFLTIKLTEVTVSGYRVAVNAGALPVDQFGLLYGGISVAYAVQRPDGSASTVTVFCWDVRESRACPAG